MEDLQEDEKGTLFCLIQRHRTKIRKVKEETGLWNLERMTGDSFEKNGRTSFALCIHRWSWWTGWRGDCGGQVITRVTLVSRVKFTALP